MTTCWWHWIAVQLGATIFVVRLQNKCKCIFVPISKKKKNLPQIISMQHCIQIAIFLFVEKYLRETIAFCQARQIFYRNRHSFPHNWWLFIINTSHLNNNKKNPQALQRARNTQRWQCEMNCETWRRKNSRCRRTKDNYNGIQWNAAFMRQLGAAVGWKMKWDSKKKALKEFYLGSRIFLYKITFVIIFFSKKKYHWSLALIFL